MPSSPTFSESKAPLRYAVPPRGEYPPTRPGLRHPRIRHLPDRRRRQDPAVGGSRWVAVRGVQGGQHERDHVGLTGQAGRCDLRSAPAPPGVRHPVLTTAPGPDAGMTALDLSAPLVVSNRPRADRRAAMPGAFGLINLAYPSFTQPNSLSTTSNNLIAPQADRPRPH